MVRVKFVNEDACSSEIDKAVRHNFIGIECGYNLLEQSSVITAVSP